MTAWPGPGPGSRAAVGARNQEGRAQSTRAMTIPAFEAAEEEAQEEEQNGGTARSPLGGATWGMQTMIPAFEAAEEEAQEEESEEDGVPGRSRPQGALVGGVPTMTITAATVRVGEAAAPVRAPAVRMRDPPLQQQQHEPPPPPSPLSSNARTFGWPCQAGNSEAYWTPSLRQGARMRGDTFTLYTCRLTPPHVKTTSIT